MENPSKELLTAIALVVAIVANGHLWVAAAGACAAPAGQFGSEIHKANGCVEFWFNRYQSLFAALLATAVATATLLGLREQIAAARRQSAPGAINELEVRLEHIREAVAACDALTSLTQEIERRICYGVDRRALDQGGAIHRLPMTELAGANHHHQEAKRVE